MGTQELTPQHNPIEFSSVVKSSGIKKRVEEVIFNPLSLELNKLKYRGELEVRKNGTSFRLMPVLSEIYRFIATDHSKGISEHITVTEKLIEDKVIDEVSGNTISHLWNSPQVADRINELIHVFDTHEIRAKQEVLFDSLG